ANLGHPLHAATAMHGVNGEKFIAFGRHFGTKLAHVLLEFGFMLVTLFVILRAGHKLSGALLQGARRAFGRNGAELIERMVAAVYGTVTGLVVVG
ncbi:AI-2E family transporter, partial [Burkholderia cenocepacia]|nr:AI-2E family transporter [Burkholderia cenocepacia]MDR5670722.1 AI-2E family transporter [Burkholderia cenocepacia]